ncbi:hypothetical protein D3C74_325340 [compost metagenome]
MGDSNDSNLYQIRQNQKSGSIWGGYENKKVTLDSGSLDEIWERYKPRFRNTYLANGKLYQYGDED